MSAVTNADGPLSLVLCWPGISGYMAACWKALASRTGVRVSIISTPCHNFTPELVAGLECHIMTDAQSANAEYVAAWVRDRSPDVVSIGGWSTRAFKALTTNRAFRNIPFILAMDNPWIGTLKQQLAPIALRSFMRRFSCVVVPGERGWVFGRLLAPVGVPVMKGLYGVDVVSLAPAADARARAASWPQRFLYVGRYANVKAIDVLVEGYRRYRDIVEDAWPLTCCGAGPLSGMLADEPGVHDLGFVQPPQQPAVWEEHGVFVLASRFDPWPLVVVEACAAGLPVVCSEACGSAVELVRPYYNGVTFASESPTDLARGLAWAHANHSLLREMGRRSQELAAPYSAEMWATRWMEIVRSITGSAGRPTPPLAVSS
jgi:glycosyltransferase involved in cell wall biosynthesis